MPHIKELPCPSAAAKTSLHFHQQKIGASWFSSKIQLFDYTSRSWGIFQWNIKITDPETVDGKVHYLTTMASSDEGRKGR